MKQRQLGADKNIEVINYFWADLERQRWRRHFLHWFWFGKWDVVSIWSFFVEGLSGEIQFWSITKYKIDQFRLLMEINIFLSDSAYRTMRYVLHQFKVNSKWKNDAIKNEWDCRKINIIWIFSLPLCRSVRLNCGKQFFFRFQPIV